jgi:hypothetical protein
MERAQIPTDPECITYQVVESLSAVDTRPSYCLGGQGLAQARGLMMDEPGLQFLRGAQILTRSRAGVAEDRGLPSIRRYRPLR